MLTKTYDQDYAIDKVTSSVAGGLTLDLGVDVMGDITSASGTVNPATPTRHYLYDPLYRLTTAQTGATPPGPLEAYSYDKTGDRLSASLNGAVATPYSYTTGTHRLASVGSTVRSYDPNGNTQTGVASGFTFTYDDKNRFAAATQGSATSSYQTNGRGERVRKGIGTTYTEYVYESGQLLGEYNGSGVAQVEYLYLDGVPVGVNTGGVRYYVETDHLGTPRQVIDPARNVAVWTWDALASTFGANSPNPDPTGDGSKFALNLRFPGQYYDAETGLNYNVFRDYDPGTGRYVESDPIGLGGGVSTYGYVDQNPTRLTDPSGLDPSCTWYPSGGTYDSPGSGTRERRINGQWWIVPLCLPYPIGPGTPGIKDPRNWMPSDFITWLIKCYKLRTVTIEKYGQVNIYQKGVYVCYEKDKCGAPTFSENEADKLLGSEWRLEYTYDFIEAKYFVSMKTY